jgi:hypothetical protein
MAPPTSTVVSQSERCVTVTPGGVSNLLTIDISYIYIYIYIYICCYIRFCSLQIFGIYMVKDKDNVTLEDVLQPGTNMLAAGYCMYGSSCTVTIYC